MQCVRKVYLSKINVRRYPLTFRTHTHTHSLRENMHKLYSIPTTNTHKKNAMVVIHKTRQGMKTVGFKKKQWRSERGSEEEE